MKINRSFILKTASVTLLCTYATSALSQDFWANRRGGGAAEITIQGFTRSESFEGISRQEAILIDENAEEIEQSNYPYVVRVTKDVYTTPRGLDITFTARAEQVDSEISADSFSTVGVEDGDVQATLTDGSGQELEVQLVDDGSGADQQGGDSVYSAKVSLTSPGSYEIKVVFDGKISGEAIRRTQFLHTSLSATRLRVETSAIESSSGTILGEIVEVGRFGLPLNVSLIQGDMPDLLKTRAEVWAKDLLGNDIAVGWIGGLVEPQVSDLDVWTLPFTFHSGWLTEAVFIPPFSLRDIEIRDIDQGDQLIAENSDVPINDLPDAQSVAQILDLPIVGLDVQLDKPTLDAMLYGVYPGLLDAAPVLGTRARGDAKREVLILHGWCTDERLIGQFSETIRGKALQYNGSSDGETADRYASDVAAWIGYKAGKIRGIVAHSHGGLAAASLLENFSYLFTDNASSRPPNVVSIGSPYYGASLLSGASNGEFRKWASKVANAAGSCEIPYDLFPSSSSRWTNTIGWRAKLQMSAWYTTHTSSAGPESRKCNFASKAFIDGADDGILAPPDGLGFADGGNYDRTYSGYCHADYVRQGTTGRRKDQWKYPPFVSQVNNLFFSETENYQPF